MVHISNKIFSQNKSIIQTLTNIFGINKWTAQYICKHTGINPSIRILILKKTKIYNLINFINKNIEIEYDLKKKLKLFLKDLHELKTYRGMRIWHGLPVRGQRTKTNNRTKRKLYATKKKI